MGSDEMTKLEDIKPLVEEETNRAIKIYGMFNTYHEAYAVLLEEVEEAKEDLEYIERRMNEMWTAVRNDSEDSFMESVLRAGTEANHLICEAIQVSAVLLKAVKTFDTKQNKTCKNCRLFTGESPNGKLENICLVDTNTHETNDYCERFELKER